MRVLYYSHNNSDAGHIQKTLVIAERVVLDFPQATQLLVTDTPQPHGVKLPHRLDFIKLPGTVRSLEGGFHEPSLLLPLGAAQSLREELVLNTIKYFRPNVVFMNKTVNWTEGELDRFLNYLGRECPETKLTIGMGYIGNAVSISANKAIIYNAHSQVSFAAA